MPRPWINQSCLAIIRSGAACVLFQPVDVNVPVAGTSAVTAGPLIQMLAQQARINVTLASQGYSFDYTNPNSVCGIAHAARNTALLWGCFTALVVAALMCVWLWQRHRPGPQGGLFSHWRLSTVLRHERLRVGRQLADRVCFLVSDVACTTYSQVTDAITIHQVISSRQLVYAYLLLAILLVPFAVMFILVVRLSSKRCQKKIGSKMSVHRAAAPLIWAVVSSNLFLVSATASLLLVLKSVVFITIELHLYGCNVLGYCFTLVQFKTFGGYKGLIDAGLVAATSSDTSNAIQLTPPRS